MSAFFERLRRPRPRLLALGALALMLLATIAFVVAPALSAQRRWQDLRARGVLRVGIDASWQPFSYFGANGWEGFDADLTAALGARLGLRIETFPVGFDSRYDALKTNLVDVAISALVADPTQTQDAAYSQPYFDAGPRLIVPRASPIRGTGDLDRKRVGVALGGAADRAARFWQRRSADLARLPAASDDAVMTQLRAGAIDAAMIDGLYAVRLGCPATGAGDAGDWRCVAIEPNAYVVALRASDGALLSAVNSALDELIADGTVARLAAKWVR